jgi:hypothetical protein
MKSGRPGYLNAVGRYPRSVSERRDRVRGEVSGQGRAHCYTAKPMPSVNVCNDGLVA